MLKRLSFIISNSMKYQVLIVLSIVMICSCNITPKQDESFEKNYKLSILGEISDVYYTQMARGGENDYFLISNVYIFQNDSQEYVPYASGAFDNINDISIKLTSGQKYKFCVSYVPAEADWHGYISDSLGAFEYGSSTRDLCTSRYKATLDYWTTHPLYERFYCEQEFVASDVYSDVILNMKRCSAKLSIHSDNLRFGKIKAVINFAVPDFFELNQTLSVVITPDNRTAEALFSLKDATLCWNNDEYQESFITDFYFVNGDTEIKFDSRELTFRRNTITNVSISVGDADNNAGLIIRFDSDYENGGTEMIEYQP